MLLETKKQKQKKLFYFFIGLSFIFILWAFYRLFFRSLPIWFTEVFAKAIFFGFPAWYFSLANKKRIYEYLDFSKFINGLFLGLGYAILFSTVSLILIALNDFNSISYSFSIFFSSVFWTQFFLSIWSTFWETLFFNVFVQLTLLTLLKNEILSILYTSIIFTVFHLPFIFIIFGFSYMAFVSAYIFFFFSFGQSLLFLRLKNFYASIIIFLFWGMAVSFIHF